MHLLHAAWHRKRFRSSLTHACFLLVLHHQWHTEWGPPSWTFPPKIIVPSHQEIESLDAATVSRPGIRSHHLSTPTPICFYLVFFFRGLLPLRSLNPRFVRLTYFSFWNPTSPNVLSSYLQSHWFRGKSYSWNNKTCLFLKGGGGRKKWKKTKQSVELKEGEKGSARLAVVAAVCVHSCFTASQSGVVSVSLSTPRPAPFVPQPYRKIKMNSWLLRPILHALCTGLRSSSKNRG